MIGDDLVFYASPWSPPAFMKTNKNMLRGGSLLPEYYQAWANYFVKFIEAYEAEGLPVWGVTIQNEPMATQRWESCIYTAEQERDFLKNNLGPTMEAAGYGDKKIVVWDHNRDLITHRANTIFDDPDAAKYAWGTGFHWYETWTGGNPKYENLKLIKEAYPDKQLLFTEGCQEGFDAAHYERWSNAERYGNSMINDFNSGTVGWTDWNILLDETGGPNHVQNLCFAPIHADTQNDSLIFTPTYYYIGHFSRFIEPGALRVSTSASRSTIESTTFQNPDGTLVNGHGGYEPNRRSVGLHVGCGRAGGPNVHSSARHAHAGLLSQSTHHNRAASRTVRRHDIQAVGKTRCPLCSRAQGLLQHRSSVHRPQRHLQWVVCGVVQREAGWWVLVKHLQCFWLRRCN